MLLRKKTSKNGYAEMSILCSNIAMTDTLHNIGKNTYITFSTTSNGYDTQNGVLHIYKENPVIEWLCTPTKYNIKACNSLLNKWLDISNEENYVGLSFQERIGLLAKFLKSL